MARKRPSKPRPMPKPPKKPGSEGKPPKLMPLYPRRDKPTIKPKRSK